MEVNSLMLEMSSIKLFEIFPVVVTKKQAHCESIRDFFMGRTKLA